MRVLLVRHGQSMNNELREQSELMYEHKRTEDADITLKGQKESRELGETFRQLGIQVDGIFTSAFQRAIKTAACFREGYQQQGLEV